MESVKIRLSVLWLVGLLWGVVGTMLMMFEPGIMEQILIGELEGVQITQEVLFVLAIMMLIPLVMAFLSLTLKDKANRWANIIVGIFFTGYGLFDLLVNLEKYSAYMIFVGIVGLVFTALIIWYAWKWQKD